MTKTGSKGKADVIFCSCQGLELGVRGELDEDSKAAILFSAVGSMKAATEPAKSF